MGIAAAQQHAAGEPVEGLQVGLNRLSLPHTPTRMHFPPAPIAATCLTRQQALVRVS